MRLTVELLLQEQLTQGLMAIEIVTQNGDF